MSVASDQDPVWIWPNWCFYSPCSWTEVGFIYFSAEVQAEKLQQKNAYYYCL